MCLCLVAQKTKEKQRMLGGISGLKIFRVSIQLVRQHFEELRKIASRVLENRDPYQKQTRLGSVKVSHRSRVFKTRVLCKKNFTYSSVFKPYSDVFKPYSDVLKPYSGVFLQFMQIESLKLDFHIDFFLTSLSNRELKTRVLSQNSSFKHSRCQFSILF